MSTGFPSPLNQRILQEADIEIDHKPLYLKDKAPSVYADFTSPNEAHLTISIDPEITNLLTNPTFTQAIEAKLGDFSTVEIHVAPNKEVSVRLPGTELYELINVRDEHINRDLTHIVRKTQAAYARIQDSLPPSSYTPKPLDPRRIQEHPESLPKGMEDLRSQVTDLQHQLHALKLQGKLDQKRHAVQELSRQVRELRDENADVHRILQNAQALFHDEEDPDLVTAIQDLQDKLDTSQLTVKGLVVELEALRQAKNKEVGALEASLAEAHALFDPKDTRALPLKIQDLQQQLQALSPLQDEVRRLQAVIKELKREGSAVIGLPEALSTLQTAHDTLQQKHTQTQTALSKLQQALQEAHSQKGLDDSRIRDLVDFTSELQQSQDILKQNLSDAGGEIRSLKRELSDTKEALKRDRTSLKQSEKENVRLHQMLEAIDFHLPDSDLPLSQRVEALAFQSDDQNEQLQDLLTLFDPSDTRGLKEKILELQMDLHETQAQRSALSRHALDTDRLEQSLEAALDRQLQQTAALQKELHSAQDQNALLSKGLDEARPQLAAALKELQQLRPLAAKVPSLEKTLDAVRAALEGDKDADLLHLAQAVMGELRHLQDVHPKTATQCEIHAANLSAATQQIEELEALEDTSATRIQELEKALQTQKDALESRIAALESQLGTASSQNAALQKANKAQLAILKQVQQGLNVDGALGSLPTHVSELVQRHETLTAKLSQVEQAAEDKEGSLQKDLDAAQEELATATRKLGGDNAQLTASIQEYAATLADIQKALPDGLQGPLPAQVTALAEASADLQKQLSESDLANDDFIATNASLQQQVDELASTHQHVQRLEKQLKDSEGALAQQSASLKESQARLQEAEHTNRDHQATLKSIQTQLKAPDANPKEIVENIAVLQQALNRSQQQLHEATDAYSQLQGTAQATAKELHAAQGQNVLLKEALDEAKPQLTAALKELEQLRPLAAKVPSLEKTLDAVHAALGDDKDIDLLPLAQAVMGELRLLQDVHPKTAAECEIHAANLSAATQQIEELEALEDTSATRIQELEKALQTQKGTLESRIAALESQLEAASSQNAALQKTLGATQNSLDHQSEQNAALQKANKAQLAILKQVQQGLNVDGALGSLPTHVSELVQRHETLTAKLSQVEQAAEDKEGSLQKDLDAAQEELATATRKLGGDNAQLTASIQEYAATLADIQKALPDGLQGPLPAQVTALAEASADLQKQLDESDLANDALIATNASLQQQVDELTSIQSHAKKLEKQLEDSEGALAQQSDSLKESQARLQEAEHTNRDHQAALKSIQTQLKAPDANPKEIVEKIAALQKALHASRSQNTQDQEAIAVLKAELRSLERSLGGQNKDLAEQVRTLQVKLVGIEQLLPEGDKGASELQERVGSFKKAYEQLKADLEKTTATNLHLEDRIQALDTVLRQREASIEDLRATRTTLQDQHTSDVTTNTRLAKELAQAKEELQAVQHTLAASEARFVEFESSEREVERLTAILTGLQKQLRDPMSLQAQLEAVGEVAQSPFESISQLVKSRLSEVAQAQEVVQKQAAELDELREARFALEESHHQQLEKMTGKTSAEKQRLEKEFEALRKVEQSGYAKAKAHFEKSKEGLVKTIKTLRQEVADHKQELQDTLETQTPLREENRRLRGVNFHLKKELTSSEALIKEKDQDLVDEFRRVDKYVKEISALQRERADLVAQLEEQGDELNESIDVSSYHQEKREDIQRRNEELAEKVDVLEDHLEKAQERISILTQENKTLRRLLGKVHGVVDDAPLPSLEELEHHSHRFLRKYGSTLQVIEERDLVREELVAVSDTAQRTQEALDAITVVAQQKEKELFVLQEEHRLVKAAEEENQRKQMAIVKQLQEMAPIAEAENEAAIKTGLKSDQSDIQTVLETGQGLLALVEAMGKTAKPLPKLTHLQQEIVKVNHAVLGSSSSEQEHILGIQRKLSRYNDKPPTALLAIFKDDAVKIQQFCESINKLLKEEVTTDDTDLDLVVDQTPLRALEVIQTLLTKANAEIIEHHRRLEARETTVDDLDRIEEVCADISFYKQEMQNIAQAFIPRILDTCTTKEMRNYPFILRELRGWMGFFDQLPPQFKNASGHIEIPAKTSTTNPDQVQHFREAVTELNGTLEEFFRLF